MNVNIGFAKLFRFGADLAIAASDQAKRGLHRLLHHVSDLPGQGDVPLAWVTRCFDVQYLAAHWRISESGDNPRFTGLQSGLANVTLRPQHLPDQLWPDDDSVALTPGNLGGHSTTNCTDLALQLSNASFAGVVINDQPERVLLPFALLGLEPVLFQLPANQISLSDFEFLPLGVTGKRNHFHPIPHRLGNTVHVVSGRDKNDLREIEG